MPQETFLQVRVPVDLLKQVRSVAGSRDETMSQVVRRLLRHYVTSGPAQMDLEVAIAEERICQSGGR